MSADFDHTVRPKRVLIIGGGVSGLVTLRALSSRECFDQVELVERRDDVGGVWYLDNPAQTSVPGAPRWPSPAYPDLIGNVLPEYLSISGNPFPPPHKQYPTLQETQDYLCEFAKPLKNHIRLNVEVVSVEELKNGWRVLLKDWNEGGKEVEQHWDAVVSAVAWYDNHVWPDVLGIAEARERGIVKHAKFWRGPQSSHSSKRILVVGNGNSSNDIAAQLAPVAESVYRSIRRPPIPRFPALLDPRILDVAPIQQFVVQSNDKLEVHLTDGTIIEDVDEVQIGTGYTHNVPFLRVRNPSTGMLEPLASANATSHPQFTRIPSLHQGILYAHNTSLAFVGNIMSYTPFTLADLSAIWLACTWSGKLSYPETVDGRLSFERERLAWVAEEQVKTGKPSLFLAFHTMATAELSYARGLRDDVLRVEPSLEGVLPTWNDEDWARRDAMYSVKLKSLSLL